MRGRRAAPPPPPITPSWRASAGPLVSCRGCSAARLRRVPSSCRLFTAALQAGRAPRERQRGHVLSCRHELTSAVLHVLVFRRDICRGRRRITTGTNWSLSERINAIYILILCGGIHKNQKNSRPRVYQTAVHGLAIFYFFPTVDSRASPTVAGNGRRRCSRCRFPPSVWGNYRRLCFNADFIFYKLFFFFFFLPGEGTKSILHLAGKKRLWIEPFL